MRTADVDWRILSLWHAGNDTYEIARQLGLRESAVANMLPYLRDLQRETQRFEARI
jgi:DNA-binding NarL/FixJ family response regulator